MIDIIGFLSRPHGFAVLNELITDKNFKIKKIFTHSLNPVSQDPQRKIRDDFLLYEKICQQNNIPLEIIDSKNDTVVIPECDYIIEVSWRYFIAKEVCMKAKKCAFGIHRGKLPDYAGAEPIKQALMKNENNITLSAHNLLAEIDMGEIINEIDYPVNYNKSKTLDENVQRLRNEITPLFSKVVIETINKIERA